MTDQTHVIDIDIRLISLRQEDGKVPELKTVDAIVAFGDGKERLSIHALDPHCHHDLALKLHRAAVECSVDTQSFNQERVRVVIEIVAPEDRRMRGSQHRIQVALYDAIVAFKAVVRTFQQLPLPAHQFFQSCLKLTTFHVCSRLLTIPKLDPSVLRVSAKDNLHEVVTTGSSFKVVFNRQFVTVGVYFGGIGSDFWSHLLETLTVSRKINFKVLLRFLHQCQKSDGMQRFIGAIDNPV